MDGTEVKDQAVVFHARDHRPIVLAKVAGKVVGRTIVARNH